MIPFAAFLIPFWLFFVFVLLQMIWRSLQEKRSAKVKSEATLKPFFPPWFVVLATALGGVTFVLALLPVVLRAMDAFDPPLKMPPVVRGNIANKTSSNLLIREIAVGSQSERYPAFWIPMNNIAKKGYVGGGFSVSLDPNATSISVRADEAKFSCQIQDAVPIDDCYLVVVLNDSGASCKCSRNAQLLPRR